MEAATLDWIRAGGRRRQTSVMALLLLGFRDLNHLLVALCFPKQEVAVPVSAGGCLPAVSIGRSPPVAGGVFRSNSAAGVTKSAELHKETETRLEMLK